MRGLLRLVALSPFALGLALFVHAFAGRDHALADGHQVDLGLALVAGLLLSLGADAAAAFTRRRAGRRDAILPEGAAARALLPLTAVMVLEGLLAYAGLEASEGRLAAALHLNALEIGGLFAAFGAPLTLVVRLLARWAARLGVRLAETIDVSRTAATIARRAFRRVRPRVAPCRGRRLGRAPPLPAPR